MAGIVPPQIESPKTFIGVGAREVTILGASGLLGLVILFIPIHLAIRIGVAVLVVGLGLAVAFGRDRRSGKTVEAYLFDLLRFHRRKRFRQKGSSERGRPARELSVAASQEVSDIEAAAPRGTAGMEKDGWIRVRPLPLGAGLLFSILSFAFLASLLVWIWLGGVAEIQVWIGVGGF